MIGWLFVSAIFFLILVLVLKSQKPGMSVQNDERLPSDDEAHAEKTVSEQNVELDPRLDRIAEELRNVVAARGETRGINSEALLDHLKLVKPVFHELAAHMRREATPEKPFDLQACVEAMLRAEDTVLDILAETYPPDNVVHREGYGVTDTFPVPLVGEQHYQAAVQRCRKGMAVELLCEPTNPYDAGAIVAVHPDGSTLGYVPKDSFVQRAVHDEGKGAAAVVRSMGAGQRGFVQIVLDVTLTSEPLDERAFTRS